jgi:hypothetical protein
MNGLYPEPPQLEFEGATLSVGEVVAGAVAEELDHLASLAGTLDEARRTEARAIARELRLWVFLASVCDPADREERAGLLGRLEQLGGRTHGLTCPPEAAAGVSPRLPREEQRAIAARIIDIQESGIFGDEGHGYEDEMTDVKRAKWERNTNRALSPSNPPPGLASGRFHITNEKTPQA